MIAGENCLKDDPYADDLEDHNGECGVIELRGGVTPSADFAYDSCRTAVRRRHRRCASP